MANQFDSLGLFSSPYQQASGWVIACLVVALHVGLLGIGHFWNSTPPVPKARSKVIVQTIRLAPSSLATSIQNASPVVEQPLLAANFEHLPPLPLLEEPILEEPAPEKTAEPTKKEEPIKKEEPVQKVVEPVQKVEPAVKKAELPKTESKPPPKPTASDIKKPAAAKPAEKKQVTPVPPKPVKNDPKAQEAEKKKQEKAQADKKRQQEQAAAQAAEKKRQQEVAAAQEAAHQKQQVLLAKAKENLAKMSETRDKISQSTASSVKLATTPLPKEVSHLQIDALPLGEVGSTAQAGEWGVKEISYRDEIVYRVKTALKFPDYGTVKIKLTLDRTGKVTKVETMQSESAKNKAYLERTLPTLQFSAFGQQFSGAAQYTFLITLHNDN